MNFRMSHLVSRISYLASAQYCLGAVVLFLSAAALAGCVSLGVGSRTRVEDVRPEYRNRPVTALGEDCETVRLALGVAWDDALACRSFSGYLTPWTAEDRQAEAEAMVKRGTRLYELVKCVDDGIISTRFSRDSRDAPNLERDCAFWRNELALAARQVTAYAADAAALKTALTRQLAEGAARRGIRAVAAPGLPWDSAEREAWRQAGPMTGVRLPLEPHPAALATWWNANLSLAPGYLVGKLESAGDAVFSGERPVGAWGSNCAAAGKYEWAKLNQTIRLVRDRGGKFLLELPTLTERKTDAQLADEAKKGHDQAWWIWTLYAPVLPKYLENDPRAALLTRQDDGTLRAWGGVQLFTPAVAAAYGEYLKAMADNLRREGLYESVAAVHLEVGDTAELPEAVDYSETARERWQAFLHKRYTDVAALNRAAGTNAKSFQDMDIPVRVLLPLAAADWAECRQDGKPKSANDWGGFMMRKYKNEEGIRAVYGDDFHDGYGWRLPFDYPPVLKIDYLHFRRQWVADYLAVKEKLVRAAFPDKLVIREMRQFGDHDGIAGKAEVKWGGFRGPTEDLAQFTNVGPENERQPFMIRSVGPPGFGTRPSDSIESLFRDYLWINFRDPGNLTRYFYHWVAHGYLDYQLGWHSVTNHWLTNRRVYALGPTVANTAPQPTGIGLLLPRETFDLLEGAIYYEYLGWDWLLGAAKLPYTRIDESFVRAGGLARLNLKILILPDARAMDATLAAALDQWVAGGGVLVASTVPGKMDEYGRALPEPALTKVLGAVPDGTTSEAVAGTPLTVTLPHGIFTGLWATTTNRKPPFEVLKPTTAKVLASYLSGKPAITLNEHGKGRAVTLGYPFGSEAVVADKTSVGFYRTYTCFVREPQLIERAAWLRDFITRQLGYRPEFGVEFAEVERFKAKEAEALGLGVPKGFSQTPGDWFYVRTVGDPRGAAHELELERETPDLALRFFPRQRAGLDTTYLGISTREVHYIAPRGLVNMILARHTYRCRINNPKIQALWDVGRNVPIGFAPDADGVTFTVSLPSGHIMLLAVSEKPAVQLFAPAEFPGRGKVEIGATCQRLAGGEPPPRVVNLTPGEIRPWLEALAKPAPVAQDGKGPPVKPAMLISYGQEANRPAAEKLAAFLRAEFALDVALTEQSAQATAVDRDQKLGDWKKPLVFIGDEWTNNDLALHGAYWNWGNQYGPHLPFTTSYVWPGDGRAVISLSRRYALIDPNGREVGGGGANFSHQIRLAEDRFPDVRRKLHIAANGADALAAVETLLRELGSKLAR